jgi:hypothetical protein
MLGSSFFQVLTTSRNVSAGHNPLPFALPLSQHGQQPWHSKNHLVAAGLHIMSFQQQCFHKASQGSRPRSSINSHLALESGACLTPYLAQSMPPSCLDLVVSKGVRQTLVITIDSHVTTVTLSIPTNWVEKRETQTPK